MSKSSQDTINNFTKSELKTELNKQDLLLSGEKEDLAKRLMETLNKEKNKLINLKNVQKMYE